MDLLDHGRVEPGELLEERWFFGNLLHGNSRTFMRRHSDPCPMNLVPEKSMEETYSSIKKIPQGRRSSLTRAAPGLMKTTSMPSNVKNSKESSTRINTAQCGHLLRAPSLPTFAEKEEEFHDEESEFSMGKLIRQASLNHARLHQPPAPTVKGLTRSYSISTVPEQTQPENIIKIIGRDCEEMKQRKVTNQASARKSVYDNNTEELQRLNKKLSLKLQERRRVGSRDAEKVIRRSNSSDAWAAKSCGSPPTPFQNGAAAKKSAQDMKAQIKFWARAVASNVRQEC